MENMELYREFATTPKEAQRSITAGRLKGFTDINPMWRIKRLTEVFGPCGIGWKYIPRKREFVSGANGEIVCFVDIDLFYKQGGEWSEAVPGNGGSQFVSKERNGLYTSDEAVKMATTDAIGSACKLLGMSSDIYYANDRTKYSSAPAGGSGESKGEPVKRKCACCGRDIQGVRFQNGKEYTVEELVANSKKDFGIEMCYNCLSESYKKVQEARAKSGGQA